MRLFVSPAFALYIYQLACQRPKVHFPSLYPQKHTLIDERPLADALQVDFKLIEPGLQFLDSTLKLFNSRCNRLIFTK